MLAHRVLRQEGHLERHPKEGYQRYMRRAEEGLQYMPGPGNTCLVRVELSKYDAPIRPGVAPTQPALTLLRFRTVPRSMPNSLDIDLAFDHLVHRNIRPRSEDELTRTVRRTLPSHIRRRPPA